MALMNIKTYPAYKDSGSEWIDEIPEHWSLSKLKHIISESLAYGVLKPDKFEGDGGIPLVRIMDISNGVVNYDGLEIISPSQDFEYRRTKLNLGDLVVSVVGTLGRCFIVSNRLESANLSRALARIQVDSEVDVHWLKYYFHTHLFQILTDITAQGTAQRVLNLGDLSNFTIPVPIIDEQQAIADYLDKKTVLIDELIGKKQRQVELLKEQRQAVINQAVTKGLDPNVEMKDSGIYWLNSIPKSWALKKFSYCTTIRSGQVDPSVEPYCDMPLIAPNHIESKTGRVLNIETAKEQGADSGKYLFEKDEVLYSKIRPHLQKVCIAPLDGICSADMYAIKPIDELLNTFLAYFMLTEEFTAYTIDKSMRVAMPKINRDDLTKSFIVFPDKSEQEAIVEYIETKKAKFNQSIGNAEGQIQLLQEYRTALISEAVTGKIDVREAV